MSAYTSDGRRRSSITHSRRGHKCELCERVAYGNGGQVAHGRAHVRKGEAVELFKWYGDVAGSSRFFLAPGDPAVDRFVADGFEVRAI